MTETINLQAVLKAGSSSQGQKKQRLLKPPQCGILTRTVVESHLVNSILPVRLRSPRHNDVAFIGVSPVFPSFGCPSEPWCLTQGTTHSWHLPRPSPTSYLMPSSLILLDRTTTFGYESFRGMVN